MDVVSVRPESNWNIPFSLLGQDEAYVIDILQVLDLLFDPFGTYILSLEILTDLYVAPTASSPGDFQNVAGPIAIDQYHQQPASTKTTDNPSRSTAGSTSTGKTRK